MNFLRENGEDTGIFFFQIDVTNTFFCLLKGVREGQGTGGGGGEWG